ncbi:MAG: glutamate--tRNA ligase [bacterium]|nr:glutamate--tRNA ligase [bacterium]
MKTRFAPSPTGFLHIGGFRTALFAYLHAKKNNGKFLLRIEDTDRERFVEGGMDNILNSLYWAGIVPDEGITIKNNKVIQKGKDGPYIQSERLEIYKKHISILLDNGTAYKCFCTKERLDILRKNQEKNKMPTGYDSYCANLSEDELKEKLDNSEKFVIRFKIPKDQVIVVRDLIRGDVKFATNLLDDHVLIKSDGFPTYHFAVVVDDHLMKITDVIRGEEWLPSTPRHIALYNAFGWNIPVFAHLPLLINEQKQKLSKRHGDVSVTDFIEKGYLAEGLINFVAFLGWNPGDEREIFSIKELESEFDINKVGKSPAVFNIDKLNWITGQYIKKMDNTDLGTLILPYLNNSDLCSTAEMIDSTLIALAKMCKDRMTKLSDIVELSGFIFPNFLEYDVNLLVWKKSDLNSAKNNLKCLLDFLDKIENKYWNEEWLDEKIQSWIQANNYSVGEILWPMRVALSGQKNSPGPFEIASVLGKEKTLNRIRYAISSL